MKQRLLVLGGGLFLADSTRRLVDGGFEVVCLDRSENAPAKRFAHHFEAVDISDPEGVLSAAKRWKVDGILPLNDFATPAAARASALLGLPGLSESAAIAATSKAKMRELWQDAALPQPDFRVVSSVQDAMGAIGDLGLPLIVKPSYSGGGGRGVSILQDGSFMHEAYSKAMSCDRLGLVMIEEFIEGTEVTVESISSNGRVHILAMSDKIKPAGKPWVATDLFYPAKFSADILESCRRLAADAVLALGIDIGAAHTELIVKSDGEPMLVECGARGGGGHICSRIVEWVSSLSLPILWAGQLCGDDPRIAKPSRRAAIYHFFCPPPGRLVAIKGMRKAHAMKGVAAIGSLREIGDEILPLADSMQRSGYAVILAERRSEAETILADLERTVHYVVE